MADTEIVIDVDPHQQSTFLTPARLCSSEQSTTVQNAIERVTIPAMQSSVSLWTRLDSFSLGRVLEAAAELEELGFAALWSPEGFGRDPLVLSGLLLGATSSMTVATGVATIYARDPACMSSSWRTLTEAYPGRFVLGVGSSHKKLAGMRDAAYRRGVPAMQAYLDQMDTTAYGSMTPSEAPVRVLGALGPRMTALARDRADGCLTYMTTPDHTAWARDILGPDKKLVVEQRVVLSADPEIARTMFRQSFAMSAQLPIYVNSFRRMGFSDDDLAAGGTDRFVDALGVWGDEGDVAARVREHLDAGADQVCMQVLTGDPTRIPLEEWRRLSAVSSESLSRSTGLA
jgi:probable F420-dependent oxidoreductase